MGCPHCQSSEISPDGVCLICGLRVAADIPAQNPEAADPTTPELEGAAEENATGHSGMIEMDYSEGTESEEASEVPPWRQELSQRLHEIKQKREAVAATQQESKLTAPVSQAKAAEALSALQARLLEKMPPRKPQPPAAPPPRQKTLEPVPPEPAVREPIPPPAPQPDEREIRNLIDNAVSRQAPQLIAPVIAAQTISPAVVAEDYEPESLPDEEGKLILLSRTLSGLVDLIVLILCTGVFIICADFFSGILVLDGVSLLNFSLLFLLNFFLYSLFFLSASNQTIGMMITDLRVVGVGRNRPTVRQLLGRCCMYLISLFCLGIGLLLSLFDRDNKCLHDRTSGTRVVRI